MPSCGQRWVLGSRSPRRLELLRLLVPAESIDVVPPRSAQEAGFEGLRDWPAITGQLARIARTKCGDVVDQVRRSFAPVAANSPGEIDPVVITADTAVVVADEAVVAADEDGGLLVLGQPPEDGTWRETVRRWFRKHYFGRTHTAVTAVCVATGGDRLERVVRTEVTFGADGEQWLEWYLATGEPRGKAGGYAIQGAGSLFIERVTGSLSNVIGLPLRELSEMLEIGNIGE